MHKQSIKNLIITGLALMSFGFLSAQFVIPSGIDNALQIIKSIWVTTSGTSTGNTLMYINTGNNNIYINPAYLSTGSAYSGNYYLTLNASGYLSFANIQTIVGATGATGSAGVGISNMSVNGSGHLIINLSNGSTIDAGNIIGPQGIQGVAGQDGINGTNGLDGTDGVGIVSIVDNNNGTFTINLSNGSDFTTQDLTGPQGPAGTDGQDGTPGQDGAAGEDGLSAYEVAVQNGFTGTESQWLESLIGPQGPQGATGATGPAGQDGIGVAQELSFNTGDNTLTISDGNSVALTFWSLFGNIIDDTIHFLGTTTNQALRFVTNNIERIRVLATGEVGIGTSNPDHTLTVSGTFSSFDGGQGFTASSDLLGMGIPGALGRVSSGTELGFIMAGNPSASNLGFLYGTIGAYIGFVDMSGDNDRSTIQAKSGHIQLDIAQNDVQQSRIDLTPDYFDISNSGAMHTNIHINFATNNIGILTRSPSNTIDIAQTNVANTLGLRFSHATSNSGWVVGLNQFGDLVTLANINSLGGGGPVGPWEYGAGSPQSAQIMGASNNASGSYTVVGGRLNTAISSGSFVGGGQSNTIQTNTDFSSIVGGRNNSIIGTGSGGKIASDGAIIGGQNNSLYFSQRGFIGGGGTNTITGDTSNIVGGYLNRIHGHSSSIVGGTDNIIGLTPGLELSIGSFIAGGMNNNLAGEGGFIGAGAENSIVNGIHNSGQPAYSSIIGGSKNMIDNAGYAFIGGGLRNVVFGGFLGFIGAGIDNVITGGSSNSIVGGIDNGIDTDGAAFIGGGENNKIFGSRSSIVGGQNNIIQAESTHSFIGGGYSGSIFGNNNAIVGGDNNTIGSPVASSDFNMLFGLNNVIIGGSHNILLGSNISVNHSNVFARSDGTTLSSANNNTFLIHASNGVGINTNNPQKALHVSGAVVSSIRTITSDSPDMFYQSGSNEYFFSIDVAGVNTVEINPTPGQTFYIVGMRNSTPGQKITLITTSIDKQSGNNANISNPIILFPSADTMLAGFNNQAYNNLPTSTSLIYTFDTTDFYGFVGPVINLCGGRDEGYGCVTGASVVSNGTYMVPSHGY